MPAHYAGQTDLLPAQTNDELKAVFSTEVNEMLAFCAYWEGKAKTNADEFYRYVRKAVEGG